MAKVTGPLLSLSAKGSVGKALVFFEIPHLVGQTAVRQWIAPMNPKSADQGDIRLYLSAAGRGVKRIEKGSPAHEAIVAKTPIGQLWNSYLVRNIIGDSGANISAALTEFENLSSETKASWNDAADGAGFEASEVTYSAVADITAGETLYALAKGCYYLGTSIAATDPASWDETAIGTFTGKLTVS